MHDGHMIGLKSIFHENQKRGSDKVSNPVFMTADGVAKSFGIVQALRHVSLDFHGGEILALVGENGAGKSTLMRILEGVFAPDSGRILINGSPQMFKSPRDAREKGVRIIHQEPEIVPYMSVGENIFIGDLPRFGAAFLNRARLRENTRRLLIEFGMETELDPEQHCIGLGPAQRQMIEIMRAVHAGGRLIAFDEPTSSLTDEESRRLFAIIRRLKMQGAAIIYISHRLGEIIDLADRIAVLRDGKITEVMDAVNANEENITRKMIGRDLAEMFPPREGKKGDIVLEVNAMTTDHVHDISFTLRAGEVLGIGGLMGAGRSELAMGIFGYHRRLKGQVMIDGVTLPAGDTAAAIIAGLGLAPEDRKEEALLLMRSILDNAVLCVPDKITRFGFYSRQLATDLVAHTAKKLAIKAPSLDTSTASLSGGNQQKVVLARWLIRQPKVLILDEPTRGIDVGAKAEIYALIRTLTKAGLGVIVISSEMGELIGLSDRILVIAEGRISAELTDDAINEENILRSAMPKSTAALH